MKILVNALKALGLVCALWAGTVVAQSDQFEQLVEQLNASSYSDKRAAIINLRSVDDSRVLPALQAMLSGNLFYHQASQALVTAVETSEGWVITNVVTEERQQAVNSASLQKMRINNSVRTELRSAIAALQLTAKSKSVRAQSARNLIKRPEAELRSVVVDAIARESDSGVRRDMQVALAMIDVNSDNVGQRQNAVEALAQSVEPEVIAVLRNLARRDEAGAFIEQNRAVAESAEKSLQQVSSRISFYKFIENLFFGLSLGSVLLLAAIGLAITFGVMGVINMAHGEMIMLGAYTTFAVQQLFPGLIDYSVIIAIPAAFLVSGLVGVIIERTVIRHLYGRPLETLLATFGVSLILQQAVRTYNANNVPVVTPDWMSGFYQFNAALGFTYNRMYIIVFSLLVLGALALVMRKTMLGLQMRAVTQNRAMANSMGIRSSWVDALTFGLGSGVAGMAGVALSLITNVGPNLGQAYIIDSFMVVVFGGVGNLMGTLVAAMSLGVVGKFLEPFTGAVLGKIIVLIFIILFIQWRPRGLFALKGRFVGD